MLRAEKYTLDVDSYHLIPVLFTFALQGVGKIKASVVDQDVDTPEGR